jgi:hypothetical protein
MVEHADEPSNKLKTQAWTGYVGTAMQAESTEFGVGDVWTELLARETQRLERQAAREGLGVKLGFCHDGLPATDHFLGYANSFDFWRWETDMTLSCQRKRLGSREEFLWMEDGSVRHVATGLWLDVDPECPEDLALYTKKRSFWEALPPL